jgi:hypothetical protein
MTLHLTDDEARALVAHPKHALEYDPFPYAHPGGGHAEGGRSTELPRGGRSARRR